MADLHALSHQLFPPISSHGYSIVTTNNQPWSEMKSEKCFLPFVRTILGEPRIQRSGRNRLHIATSGYRCALLRIILPPDVLQDLLSWARRWETSFVVASSSSSTSWIYVNSKSQCVKQSLTSYLAWLLCLPKRLLLLTLTLYLLFHWLYIQCPIPVQYMVPLIYTRTYNWQKILTNLTKEFSFRRHN